MIIATPSKIVAVHLNYRSRAAERGRIPENPSYFLKSPSTLSTHGADIVRPAECRLLAFEGEIGIVIGETVRAIPRERAWSAVSGITAANDVGVYDLRYADPGSNVHSKGHDGFTPVGPALLDARELDPAELLLRTWVNGRLAQSALTRDDMIFDPSFVIADLSRVMTLLPGDLILMGTPTGSSVVEPGDVVEVEVSAGEHSTGRLRNSVAATDGTFPEVGAMPRVDEATRQAAYSRPVGDVR